MLYYSLGLSAVLLALVNLSVARSRNPFPTTFGLGLLFGVLPACIMLVFPAVFLQAILLNVLLLVLLIPHRGRRLYLPLSCVATLGAYGVIVVPALENREESARLREEYPLESLEERLPRRIGIPPPSKPESLESIEGLLEQASPPYGHRSRTNDLERLHNHSVNEFVNSAGFGVGRMGGMNAAPNAKLLQQGLREPVPQPDYLDPYAHPEGSLSPDVAEWVPGRMRSLHDSSVVDFLNPTGFGYVKSRSEVAGFRSHGMSKVPESTDVWKPARIELVGLLLHESPVVYRSTNLPRMSELKSVPTRPLDAFESEGIESLKQGEELFVRGTDDKARMLGAIRATKQCLECHVGNRGDLLGAFSYGFRRDAK